MFLYGHDFTAAVSALAAVSGRPAVPPRHTFGVGWSRYWQFTQGELIDEVQQMEVNLFVLAS